MTSEFSMRDFEQVLEHCRVNKTPLVVKIGATWCGPCKRIEPTFKHFLQMDFAHVASLTLDQDSAQEVTDFLHVTGLPTFIAFPFAKDQTVKESERMTGANESALHAFLARNFPKA